MHEKYANPGIYLDTEDHGRLIEENREAYARDRAERLSREVREIEQTLEWGHVSTEEAERLHAEKQRLLDDLEEMADVWGQGR